MSLKVKSNGINFNVPTIENLPTKRLEEDLVCVVTDENRGGVFVYRESNADINNGGTIFNGWTRQYDGAVNVKWFGVTSTGDTTAQLQSMFSFISTNNGGEIDFEHNATYEITDILSCPLTDNGSLKINGNNSTIHLTSSLDYLYTGVLTIGTNTANNTSAEVHNLNWNLDGVVLDWSAVNPDGGKGCILFYTRKVIVKGCNYKDVTYSACVWSEYANDVNITDCIGLNVGARSADNTEDARGDAFYIGRLGYQDVTGTISTDAVVSISNCSVRAHTAVPNVFTNKNSAHCGRVGITIEGSSTSAKKIVNVNNNYFYNYNRGIHVEGMTNLSLNINNTVFDEYGLGVWVFRDTELSNIKIDTCTFTRLLNIAVPEDNTQSGVGGYVVETVRNGSTNKITLDNCNIVIKPSGGTNIRLFGNVYNMNVSNSTIKLGNLPIIYNAENLKFKNCDISWTGKLDCDISKVSIYDSSLSATGSLTFGGLLMRPTSTFNSDEPIIVDNCVFNDVSVKVSSTSNNSKVVLSKSSFNFSSGYIQDSGDYATSISNTNKEEATIIGCTFVNSTVTRMTAHQQGPIRNFIGNTVINMYLRLATSAIPLHIDNNSFIMKSSLGFSYYIDAYLSNAMISNNTFKAYVAGLGTIQNIADALSVANTYDIDELGVITLIVKP